MIDNPADNKADHILDAIDAVEFDNDWSLFNDKILNATTHAGQLDFLKNSFSVVYPPENKELEDPTHPDHLKYVLQRTWGIQKKKENALHPGNGFGKTTIIARKHIFYILKHQAQGKSYKTLNVAITQDQAELVQDEILKLAKNSPFLSGWFISNTVKFPHAKITYFNGAITEFKTTKKKAESVEGKEYGYISADEIALEMHLEFIRDNILKPRLRAAPDSQIDFSATPKGMNAWYRVCIEIGRAGGYVRGGSSYENPYIDHELFEYQKKNWSDAKFRQIVMGEFVENSEMMFASRVDKLFDDSLSFEMAQSGHQYVEGWDLARGAKRGADQTVGFRVDKFHFPHRITQNWAFQLPWTEKERELLKSERGDVHKSSIEREIRGAQRQSGAQVYVDSTGVGDTLYLMLIDIAKPVDFRGGNKDKLLDHLQAVIDADMIRCPFIPQLADEMTMYQRDDKNLDTDYLMALAIACSTIEVRTEQKIEIVPVNVFSDKPRNAPTLRRRRPMPTFARLNR